MSEAQGQGEGMASRGQGSSTLQPILRDPWACLSSASRGLGPHPLLPPLPATPASCSRAPGAQVFAERTDEHPAEAVYSDQAVWP